MAISHVATGTIVAGTTAASPAYPAGIAAGDALFLFAGACNPAAVTYPTLSGFTLVLDLSLGGGSHGAGIGPRRMAVYRKDVVDGTETGTVTVTPTGTSDMILAGITCWRVAAGRGWDVAYASGSDTSPGTATSITADAVLGEATGDVMLGGVCGPTNSNMAGQTFNATGATYGTASEVGEIGTNNGDDGRLAILQRPITAGRATAATVYSATSTQSAGCIFVRLREVSLPSLVMARYAV